MQKIINVVLSGGVGSRLWPLSRLSAPKQYLKLFSGQSLFQHTVSRNRSLVDGLCVIGNKQNYLLSREQLVEMDIHNNTEIIEATPRNTAAAIAFAALSVHADDLLLITPSDHMILDEGDYTAAINEAVALAKKGSLVTFGIKPTRPETGFGYIEFEGNNVLSFKEKPNKATAVSFLESGNYLWNSGIFCFKAGAFLQELAHHSPDIYKAAAAAWNARTDNFLPESESLRIPSLSVDFAVMEKSEKIAVVPSVFYWSDLGSFEALWDFFQGEGRNDLFKNGNLVLNKTNKHIELYGIENLIVIQTDDVLLLIPKDESQEVKGIYERLQMEQPELIN